MCVRAYACVCVCVCVFICICVCVYMCVFIYIYVCVCVHMCMWLNMCVCIYMYMCVLYMCESMCVWVCLYIYVCVYIHVCLWACACVFISSFIIIMSRHLRGYPWPSLAISPYHSSPPAGLQDYNPCPHIAAVCKFVLVVPLLHIHEWGSTGVHRLWARPCFSSSVPRVWFVELV